MSVKNEFLEDIREQRQVSSKRKRFSGNFLDYIEHIQDNPHIVMSAHKRLYGRIVEHGSQSMPNSDPRKKKIFNSESVMIYDYFKDYFFGMENVIFKIMQYLKSAAHKGEESKQVLLLMGPVGAGKSALTELSLIHI